VRLFIALQIPIEIKHQILIACQPLTGTRRIRWIHEKALHLTLKFLGHTPESKVIDIERFINEIGQKKAPFHLHLENGGIFPVKGKPRIFWVGVGGDIKCLESLTQEIDDKFELIGFKKDAREFKPHLTVARSNNFLMREIMTTREQFCTLMSEFRSKEFCVDQIHVMRSQLNSQGSVYTSIAKIPLRPGE